MIKYICLLLSCFNSAQATDWGADEEVANLSGPNRDWTKSFNNAPNVLMPLVDDSDTGSLSDAIELCDEHAGVGNYCVVNVNLTPNDLPVTITRSNTKLEGLGPAILKSSGNGAFITIGTGVHNVFISGLELQGHQAASVSGIVIEGQNINNIAIMNNKIHGFDGIHDAHGIAVYGRGATDTAAIQNITIDQNKVFSMRTGSSESIVVNGNVKNWSISHNYVLGINNIAIDAIGGEGTAPTQIIDGKVFPGEFDAARYGQIVSNHIKNMSTESNSAYGKKVSWAAAIYVDGGHHINIRNNSVDNSPWAYEVGAENCITTSNIVLMDNYASRSHFGNLVIGGYAAGGYRDVSSNCNPTQTVDADEGHGYVENITVRRNRFSPMAEGKQSVLSQFRVTHALVVEEEGVVAINETGNGSATGDANAIRTDFAFLQMENFSVMPQIETPTVSEKVVLDVSVFCSVGATAAAIEIDNVNKQVRLSINDGEHGFLCTPTVTTQIPIGYLTEPGDYHFLIYNSAYSSFLFGTDSFVGSFDLTVVPAHLAATAETPAEGSIQSGVGVIRGWACDAVKIEVSIDDGALVPVAYGTSRGDTQASCGDTNNGYGKVIAWGVLGEGTHTLKTFRDGVEISNVSFEVAGIGGSGFTEGLSGTYDLEGFPAPGESVTVRWSQPDQNFIIIDKQ